MLHPRHDRRQQSAGSRFSRAGAVLAVCVATALAATLTGCNSGSGRHQVALEQPAAGGDEAAANCTLIVPPNPLTARGLATPYQLTSAGGGACHMSNPDQAAFVQATIVDPATGKLSVYDPLVVDRGTRAAVAPVVPMLPTGAVVGVWVGFNGDQLMLSGNARRATVRRHHGRMTLRDTSGSLRAGKCVNGTNGSPFGQFSFCNAPAFFTAANAAIKAGKLTVPPIPMAADGMPCPTTRDWSVVDQDQSDNVTSGYLITADGRTAQATAAAAARLQGAKPLFNGSDNRLLTDFVDKALQCQPFMAPNLADNGAMTTSLGLNELQAALQAPPAALIPPNNPMVTVNGQPNLAKENLYRSGVNQPAATGAGTDAVDYCRQMMGSGVERMVKDAQLLRDTASPDTEAAVNLWGFLGSRLSGSYDELGCENLLGAPNPVQIQTENDMATDWTIGAAATTAPPVDADAVAPTTAPPADADAVVPTTAPPVDADATPPAGATDPQVTTAPPAAGADQAPPAGADASAAGAATPSASAG